MIFLKKIKMNKNKQYGTEFENIEDGEVKWYKQISFEGHGLQVK